MYTVSQYLEGQAPGRGWAMVQKGVRGARGLRNEGEQGRAGMSSTPPTATSFDGGDLAFGWRHSPAPPPVGHSDQEDRLQNAASELPPGVGISLVKVGVECVWSLKLPTHYLMEPGTSAWGAGGCLMEKGRRRESSKMWAQEPVLSPSTLRTQPRAHPPSRTLS